MQPFSRNIYLYNALSNGNAGTSRGESLTWVHKDMLQLNSPGGDTLYVLVMRGRLVKVESAV